MFLLLRHKWATLGVSAGLVAVAGGAAVPDPGQYAPCQGGPAIGYLAYGNAQSTAAIANAPEAAAGPGQASGAPAYGGATVLIGGAKPVLAVPLSGDEATGTVNGLPAAVPAVRAGVPPTLTPPSVPGAGALEPVVVPSPDASLRSCDYDLSDNPGLQGLKSGAVSALQEADDITAAQAADTSEDTFMVAQDPLDQSDAVVVVRVPSGPSVPFPGGFPGTGYLPTVAYAAVLSRSGGAVAGVGEVPW
jgi:hypothetical protein